MKINIGLGFKNKREQEIFEAGEFNKLKRVGEAIDKRIKYLEEIKYKETREEGAIKCELIIQQMKQLKKELGLEQTQEAEK